VLIEGVKVGTLSATGGGTGRLRFRARPRGRDYSLGFGQPLVTRRVLLLEDDEMLAKYVGRLLARRGYEVCTASTVRAFRAAALGSRFDVLVLDASLPDGDGLDAFAEIRDAQFAAAVVLMTARGTPEVVRRAHGLGVEDVLAMPLDTAVLLSAVDAGLHAERAT